MWGSQLGGETLAAADKGLGAGQGLAGAARVIWRATRCQPISCRYRLMAASGTGLRDLKTPSWVPGLRALDGGKPRREFPKSPAPSGRQDELQRGRGGQDHGHRSQPQ